MRKRITRKQIPLMKLDGIYEKLNALRTNEEKIERFKEIIELSSKLNLYEPIDLYKYSEFQKELKTLTIEKP